MTGCQILASHGGVDVTRRRDRVRSNSLRQSSLREDRTARFGRCRTTREEDSDTLSFLPVAPCLHLRASATSSPRRCSNVRPPPSSSGRLAGSGTIAFVIVSARCRESHRIASPIYRAVIVFITDAVIVIVITVVTYPRKRRRRE